jgi:Acetoacetate decarboxylase (ADC)
MADEFFSDVEQVDVNIGDQKGLLPAFYRKARCFSAVFPANLWSIRQALPDRRFVPAQVLPGVAAIQLSAFEYYDTDLGPYNEFAICIPINSPYFPQIPGYNLLRQMLRMEYHVYFHHLPVTTEAALRGGIDFYGFPKFLASIDFSDTDEWVSCELKEGTRSICNFRGRKIPTGRTGVIKFFCNLYQWRQPQHVEGKMNAIEYAMSFKPANAELDLGSDHRLAVELANLLITTKPMLYFYIPSVQMILYGPEYMPLPLLKFSLETMSAAPDRLKEKELLAKRGK